MNYDQNHIIFNFNGICFTNPDKVAYHYKLEGYDEEWSPMVTERLAKYTGLPPGDYTFKVVSCNNEMIWNKDPVEFSFVIASPFWQKWWFRTTVIGLFAFIIWYFIYFRIRSIKKKNSLNSKMEQLKLEALRSQMNPHFIFNCMNTIQHYINSNEKKEANMFLSKFAELMRMILDNSQKSLVRLSDDLKALRLYLDLERLRFDNRFKYEINIGDGIDADSQLIPPMIIHPYVENAIIHGLLNKEAEGKVTVNLGLRDNFLICEVEDDGVGRARAEELKKDKHGHKPAGIKLTNERIETLNLLNQSQMHININDLYDENGKGNGTRVEIAIEANLD
ncbi:MAG: histidine kinase [Bacteroidetes bacterium]|nr:histidine kinase [Bacteroidota bacterium]